MKNWIFSTDFRKNTQIWILTKICPVAAELFPADRRTDMTNLTVVCHIFERAYEGTVRPLETDS